jgi:hypothetical protein
MRVLLLLTMLLAATPAKAAESDLPPLPGRLYATEGERRAVADYRARLRAYHEARQTHEQRVAAYWQEISTKRTARRQKSAGGKAMTLADYVLEQPPVYTGPDAPKRPEFMPPPAPKPVLKQRGFRRLRAGLPVVKDFLRHAKARFNFTPDKPATEADYKRAYARIALEAGIGKDQAVRIYGFEASGNGKYDVQAGLESGKPGGKPISTALGYNQLLTANTIGLVAKHGDSFLERLKVKAKTATGKRRKELNNKIAALRRMIRYANALPYRWSAHVEAAYGSKGRGLHALVLDLDLGPMLQTQKLLNSIEYAKRRGHDRRLSAAELEMLNLTGDGNGFDMITLTSDMRAKVPTSNFFERGGYERNPVASRNNVVSALLAATDRKMDKEMALDGAKELAAMFEEALKEAKSAEAVGATN